MGFKCILDGDGKYSFELSDNEWAELKGTYQNKTLISPCCKTPYIPKENSLGTRFFAHKSLNNCPYSDKRPVEQMYFKYLLARTLVELGWRVSLDRPFTANDYAWEADIFAEKNNQKFIFEILWSDLPDDAVTARLDQYKSLGIPSAWMLFKAPSKGIPYASHKVLSEQHVASFLFSYNKQEKQFKFYNIYKPIPKLTPTYSSKEIELTEFIKGLFSNQVHIFGLPKRKYNLSLVFSPQTCFQCNKTNNLIQNVCYSLSARNTSYRLWVASLCELPPEHLRTLNEYTEFREHFKFGKINYDLNIEGFATNVKSTCFHCGFINEHSLNISFYSTKNFIESQYIEVAIPDTYKENPRVFILE